MSGITDHGFYIPYADAKWIRLALRFYTTTIILLVGLIGDKCCRLLVRRRLLHSQPVRLTHIIGWQRGFSPFSMLWNLRTIPGGALMGSLMIFTSFVAIVTDLTTAVMVYNDRWNDNCPFEGGMAAMPYEIVSPYPDVDGEAASWANSAQHQSEMKVCEVGIYRLIDTGLLNSDLFDDRHLSFCAQSGDLLGKWTFENDTGNAVVFPSTTLLSDTLDALYNSNKLYPIASGFQASAFDNATQPWNSNTYFQLFVWTSEQDTPGESWDVRALVDRTHYSNVTTERRFDLLHCTVSGSHEDYINKEVLTQVDANYTLAQWSSAVQGQLYQGVGGDLYEGVAADIIASYLNSIVMVAVSGQNVTYARNESEPKSIGCKMYGAIVETPVVVLFFISVALFLGVCGFTIFPFISCQVSVWYGKEVAKRFSKYIPGSLIEWMAYALRESNVPAARDAMPKHLKGWDLTAELGGDAYSTQFVKRREPGYSAVG